MHSPMFPTVQLVDHGFMSNLVIENLIFPCFLAILRRWKVESGIIGLNLHYLLTLAIDLKLKKKFPVISSISLHLDVLPLNLGFLSDKTPS